MPSDSQLEALNKKVYSVDPNYSKTDNNVVEGGHFLVKGHWYEVVATEKVQLSGDKQDMFVGMAVAPQKADGSYDYQNITVVGGGTNPSDQYALFAAGEAKFGSVSPEYKYADDLVNKIKNTPGWHISALTGYSQSAFMVKAGAKYHIPTTIFNGWFKSSTLTKKEQEYINNHPGDFVIYRHTEDSVVKWNDGDEDDGIGIDVWVAGTSHDLTSWQFNKKGQLVDTNGNLVLSEKQGAAAGKNYDKVVAPKIKEIKIQLASGTLSGPQKIALSVELISYSAKGLKDKAEQDYADAVAEIGRLSKAAADKEQDAISYISTAGGPII